MKRFSLAIWAGLILSAGVLVQAGPYTDLYSGLTLGTMTGATATSNGRPGAVPAPAAGDQDKFAKGDGTWGVAGSDNAADLFWLSTATNWTSVDSSVASNLEALDNKLGTMGTPAAVNAIGTSATILLHMDNNLTDAVSGLTVTKSASLNYVTDPLKFGTHGIQSYATSGHNFLGTSAVAGLAVAGTDFSYDFWLYSAGGSVPKFEIFNGGTTYCAIEIKGAGGLVVVTDKTGIAYTAPAISVPTSTWTHFAVCKIDSVVVIYRNAKVAAVVAVPAKTSFDTAATAAVRLVSNDGSYRVTVDEFRYANGIAYAPLSVPTVAYSDTTGTLTSAAFSSMAYARAWQDAKAGGAAATAGVVVNTYTSSATWTKPTKAAWVEVWCIGGGAGGRGGQAKDSGLGGGGGGGGGCTYAVYPAASLSATHSVTIGAGGLGGAGQLGTAGATWPASGAGGDTVFYTSTAQGGFAVTSTGASTCIGGGGYTIYGSGKGQDGAYTMALVGSGTGTGVPPVTDALPSGRGGGAGAGTEEGGQGYKYAISSAGGCRSYGPISTGASAGATAGANGAAGAASGSLMIGGGGGGGGSKNSVWGTQGGAGGAGGFPGGGGGGGANTLCDDGTKYGGAGGNGAGGACVIVTHLGE